jgi:hypothetical protein
LIALGALCLFEPVLVLGACAFCAAFNFFHRNDRGPMHQSLGVQFDGSWSLVSLLALVGFALLVLGLRISPRRS